MDEWDTYLTERRANRLDNFEDRMGPGIGLTVLTVLGMVVTFVLTSTVILTCRLWGVI